VSRLLRFNDGASGGSTAAGCRVTLPPARLPSVRRGGRRALGREPLLSAFHRRDFLPAPDPDRSVLADPLSANVNTRLPGSGWRKRIGEEGVE
jgi:hypothetical protein